MEKFRKVSHRTDFCVIGGGMAGLCTALSAARNGVKVVLMHDRPVLGGNASSECRMHISGADRHNRIKNMRETGILEELRMKNLHGNPQRSFSVWDAILYETVKENKNITLLLNCTCLDAEMEGNKISSVKGWQLTTQAYHLVTAEIFADCSGDAVLAPLTGAHFSVGREARDEYNESIAPEKADSKTMGMTCLFGAKNLGSPQVFEPPARAYKFMSCEELPYGSDGHRWLEMGYWWIELGGENDPIGDTEEVKDQLLKTVYGVWDHIKNRCKFKKEAENWALDWIQFLPAKRESRRYKGAHILTQNDIESQGRFGDTVAYGGWPMDDHHPAGLKSVNLGKPAAINHPAPSPYGISYKCLYSRNIANLLFAGRNASCTHTAMSSTRVMGTCCSMGQAAGTAAALAVHKGILPPMMSGHMRELQQALLKDDAYLPGVKQVFPNLTAGSRLEASRGCPEPVRDGINRPVGNNIHSWECRRGDNIAYLFGVKKRVREISLILDSGLDKIAAMSRQVDDSQLTKLPEVMPESFYVEILVGGKWKKIAEEKRNYSRLARFGVNRMCEGIRFTMGKTRGAETSRIYAFYAE